MKSAQEQWECSVAPPILKAPVFVGIARCHRVCRGTALDISFKRPELRVEVYPRVRTREERRGDIKDHIASAATGFEIGVQLDLVGHARVVDQGIVSEESTSRTQPPAVRRGSASQASSRSE